MEELFKLPEAADILKVSVPKIRTLIKSGRLKYINISEGTRRKIYRISKSQIEEFKTDSLNG